MDEEQHLQIIKYIEDKHNVTVTLDCQWYRSKEKQSGSGWDLVPQSWVRDAQKN